MKRFIKVVVISALMSFSVTSIALHPQLRDSTVIQALRAQVDFAHWGLDRFSVARFLDVQAPPAPRAVSGESYVQTSFTSCTHFFPGQQPPIVPAGRALRELCFASFAVLHSGQWKTPVFVAQRLNRQMLSQAASIQRTDRFYEEARLPSSERAVLADYRASGYSRGHMAPAGDMHNDEAMAQSFSLANMVPQIQRHNAGAWGRIEEDTRKYVRRAQGDVYIFTGPVYSENPATIGDGRVAIPGYLYKVVYDATTGRSWVHWHVHSADTRAGPPISYSEFVARTGLRLLG